ncbi:substrate-binding domain-containing protein [Allokutzneria albata]|uniref:von Willebrand factor type A domain-containing protein n=1 Tax=Allokutzneria albata TaxID=211114 RepID=A0A1H0AKF8_ALLAB|nr:substrate-binding domain-containing protein [Allokutzneria albata]SDN34038.1 von Willebrand factor type A domain-containing protein [Allokutzneria albata]
MKRVALPLGVLLGVAAAAATTVVALRGWGGTCTGELPVNLAVTANMERPVRAVVEEFQADKPAVDGRCVRVKVAVKAASAVATELVNVLPGGTRTPNVWLPDSGLWPARVLQQASSASAPVPELDIRGSLASSPLVIAASMPLAEKLGEATGWRKLIQGGVPAVIGDPTSATEGLATLMLIRSLLGNNDGTPRPELVETLMKVGHNAVPAMRDAFAKVEQDPLTAPAFSTTEQSVIAHNGGAANRVSVRYAEEGTLNMDHPLVRVRSRGEPAGLDRALDLLEDALRAPAAAKRFGAAGFRDPHGAASASWPEGNGVRPAAVKLVPTPTPDQAAEVLRTFSAATLDARMLAVIDVSGSMQARAGNGQTRMELARDAALTALGVLPDSTQLGLWIFSTNHSGSQDWTQLVGLGPLMERMNGGTRRDALKAAAASLTGRTRGATGLYDTALAAWRTVRADHDPTKVNSVVLITDGRNEDQQGLDLAGLLQTLRAEANPAQPVPIILIGLGPEVDMEVLQQIGTATGGKAYAAREAGDVRGVLVDAVIQRRCRPNC